MGIEFIVILWVMGLRFIDKVPFYESNLRGYLCCEKGVSIEVSTMNCHGS